ncbi:MAG: cellulase family glycosylhydrolase [Phototrophicaceae bacterium]
MPITKDGIYFKDDAGRVRILHGVNLSGTTKLPTSPRGATHLKNSLANHRDVSFVGRPFPLGTADEHFRRLKAWGFDFLRFLVTWEAIEHAGPGEYDEDYLQYIEAVIDKAAEYDMTIFIDFHQDVWSRFTGGSGAPGWTLEKVGFEMKNFHQTGAALIHQKYGDPFPKMAWATNYSKLATATMFTLFYAGNDFAPETKIDGISAQDYLQQDYLAMLTMMAKRFKDKPHVIGYDLMNEPSKGFIGLTNVRKLEWVLKNGDMPTPYQAMLLGAGYTEEVQHWRFGMTGMHRIGRQVINPDGVRAWQDGVEPIWKANGVWDTDSHGNPILLQPEYFHRVDGKEVTFAETYMPAFINKAVEAVQEGDASAMSFVEFDAMGRELIPVWDKDEVKEQNIVYAPHWYPFITLMTKRYLASLGLDGVNNVPVFGRVAKRRAYTRNLKFHVDVAQDSFHGTPTVIGEIGIPYDLNEREGFIFNKWDAHIKAVDDYMIALERNLLNYTLWNYTPDNRNARGDLWNGEDLSIFSYDQQNDPSDINSGGRALIAVVRPYAKAIAGIPHDMQFDVEAGIFVFNFTHDDSITEPTEIYLPTLQYPDGFTVEVSDGDYDYDANTQTLFYRHSQERKKHTLTIFPKGERDIFAREKRNFLLLTLSVTSAVLFTFFFFFNGKEDEEE